MSRPRTPPSALSLWKNVVLTPISPLCLRSAALPSWGIKGSSPKRRSPPRLATKNRLAWPAEAGVRGDAAADALGYLVATKGARNLPEGILWS